MLLQCFSDMCNLPRVKHQVCIWRVQLTMTDTPCWCRYIFQLNKNSDPWSLSWCINCTRCVGLGAHLAWFLVSVNDLMNLNYVLISKSVCRCSCNILTQDLKLKLIQFTIDYVQKTCSYQKSIGYYFWFGDGVEIY